MLRWTTTRLLRAELVLAGLVDLDLGDPLRLGEGLVAAARLGEAHEVALLVLDAARGGEHAQVLGLDLDREGLLEPLEVAHGVEDVAIGLPEVLEDDVLARAAQQRERDEQVQERRRRRRGRVR